MKTGFKEIDKEINEKVGLFALVTTDNISSYVDDLFYLNVMANTKTLIISNSIALFDKTMARQLNLDVKNYREIIQNNGVDKDLVEKAYDKFGELPFAQWNINNYSTSILPNLENELKCGTKLIIITGLYAKKDYGKNDLFLGKAMTLQKLAQKYKAQIILLCKVHTKTLNFTGYYNLEDLSSWHNEFLNHTDGLFCFKSPKKYYCQNNYEGVYIDFYQNGQFIKSLNADKT